MHTRSSNANKHPGRVDQKAKGTRRSAEEMEADRAQKAADKEKRLQAKAAKARRLEEVTAHVTANDATYATPVPSRSHKGNTARTESVEDLADNAGAGNTTNQPPPPLPACTARKTSSTLTRATADNPEADTKVNSGAKAAGDGITAPKRKAPPPDDQALGRRASESRHSDINSGVAPAGTSAERPAPERPGKKLSTVMMRRPPPGVDPRRPPVSDTASKFSQDSVAKKRGRAEVAPSVYNAAPIPAADSETEDDTGPRDVYGSVTEDDSQYIPLPQTKRDMASRSAGYESHAEEHNSPPKKKAKQASAVDNRGEGRSVGEIGNVDARKGHGGAPGRKVGTVDEKFTSKKKAASAPDAAFHQTTVTSDKIKAASAAADTTTYVVTLFGLEHLTANDRHVSSHSRSNNPLLLESQQQISQECAFGTKGHHFVGGWCAERRQTWRPKVVRYPFHDHLPITYLSLNSFSTTSLNSIAHISTINWRKSLTPQ